MDGRELSRPRLLITGAGGFCGEHACRYFASAGWEVTALVRQLRLGGGSRWLDDVDKVLSGDLSLPEEANAALAAAQPQYVLHMAGKNAVGPSWSDPGDTLANNVMGTVNLLEAVRRIDRGSLNCRVLVVGSMLRFPLPAGGEAPEPPHPYSLSKTLQVLTARSWSALYGMDIVVAEPSNLIGPGRSAGLCSLLARYTAAVERAAAGISARPQPMRLSSRSETRDLLDVRDAMSAYELLLRHGGKGGIYPVASGVMRTLGELADIFTSLASYPLEFAVGDSAAQSPSPADCSAIRSLGWSPIIPLVQSLEDALEDARRAAG